jgi:hypothetical protein
MTGILPDHSAPYISLQINGVIYQYTMNKDLDADAKVHIRNENSTGDGYIFEKTDDWSGGNGGSIRKLYTFPGSNAELWGDGSMEVEGDGSISNSTLIYSYKMDIGENPISCINPLNNPSCPGFLDALYKYLQDMGLTEPPEDDPYYTAWLESQTEAEIQEEDSEENLEEEMENEEMQSRMRVEGVSNSLIDKTQQNAMLEALANLPVLESYYTVTISGGEYKDNVQIKDSVLPDNNRAMRSLSSDTQHNTMIRSQYNR